MNKRLGFFFGCALLASLYFVWKIISSSEPLQQKPLKPFIPVATEEVGQHEVERTRDFIGKLKSDKSVIIASEVGGKIERVHVKAGEKVEEGQLLISLESRKSQAVFSEAKAFFNDEKRKQAEYFKLNQKGALTKTELDAQEASLEIAKARLDAAKANREDHLIKAPFDGTVGLIDITRGQLISLSEALLHFDDLSLMQLDVNVPEEYLSELSNQISVSARTKAWSNREFKGKVTAVDTRVNNDSLNLRARIHIENTEGLLLPGMMMEANLQFKPIMSLVIPIQAIEYSGTKRYVYKVDDEGIAHRTQVELGARFNNQVTVEKGLEIKDRIVVQGLVSMRDGAKVKELNPSLGEDN